ncbi:NAD/NADP octopine/nopaline dehydrogenase family protein [Ensifer sp. YR511]|uniref:NAD/NADP octopine/nopaline dehydrogenase family protein n=1 Tax=Ensifer sp. YR511 TaxID=1855294 RepID=UPI00088DD0FB|nr:NAD/NADP octopine/nopaline dehydrogenase family protein [Ensifer sp. YR511]SDO06262.1 NAD/NADP octopine/nopaline dehydrogenase, alpha-helical domain/Glucose inhibited division protein A [Ensifer sp. YR511]
MMASSSPSNTVGIIGAGHAGVPMAAMASKAGLNVYLYADPGHRGSNFTELLQQVDGSGETTITCEEAVVGSFKIKLALDLQTVVDKCGELWNCLPEFAHDQLITELGSCNGLDNVIIGTVTANGFSLKARNRIRPRGFIDCAVAPTASRATNGKAFVAGVKEGMYIGLFPRDLPQTALDNYRKIYPHQKIRMLPNAFGALFANGNLWVHPGPLVLGLVAAEKQTPGLKFYPDVVGGKFGSNVATNVARAICNLGKAYGIEVPEGLALMTFYYNFAAESLSDFTHRLPAYNAQSFMPAAEGMESNRYMVEDPGLLNMLATLADLAGLDNRPFRGVVDMVGMAMSADYETNVADLSGLGMRGLSKADIMAAINETKVEWDERWADVSKAPRALAVDGQTSGGETEGDKKFWHYMF